MTDHNWILVDDGNETRVSGFGSGLVLLVNPFYNSKGYQNFKFNFTIESNPSKFTDIPPLFQVYTEYTVTN